MKVITLNVNGIRAGARKGLFEWLQREAPDIICLQEVRCHDAELNSAFELPGYYSYFSHAEKKGYSGVAIYTKTKPKQVDTLESWPIVCREGRYIQADFDNLSIVSIYFPSGTSSEVRQALKLDFLSHYGAVLKEQRNQNRQYIICGDFNIAHRAIDLKNWKTNQKTPGFLPEERQWLDYIFDDLGYLDAFRLLEPADNQYTWWSNFGRAFEKNVGWRIDYQVTTPGLRESLEQAYIYKKERFSDHAPVVMEYGITL